METGEPCVLQGTSGVRSYRSIAADTVNRVIEEIGRDNRPKLLNALRQAYPFPTKGGWPYRVWLQEVKARTGGFKPRRDKRQMDMFDEMSSPARGTDGSGRAQ